MDIVHKISEWLKIKKNLDSIDLGLVPTMGALHQGHLALVRQSLQDNEVTLVSIFINATQFNDAGDLKNYPQDTEQDLNLLRKMGVEYVFMPRHEEIYSDNYRYKVTESELSTQLCGKNRPNHFDGVLTVVLKLFNIIAPKRAYFGEKDYQQLLLIKGMVQHFFLPIEIVSVSIIREEDGLAMSSRNQLLSKEERILAGYFPLILRESATVSEAETRLLSDGMEVDYIEEKYGRRFGAIRIGKVRLIDNVPI